MKKPFVIDFSLGQEFIKNTSGLSGVEKWGRWIDGGKASFRVDKKFDKPSVIFFCLRCFRPPNKKNFEVSLKINGIAVKKIFCSALDEEYISLSVPIKKELYREKGVTISFEIDRPESPSSLKISGDTRELSIGIKHITIFEDFKEDFLDCLTSSIGSMEEKSNAEIISKIYKASPQARLLLRDKARVIERLPKNDYYFWQERYKSLVENLNSRIRDNRKVKVFFLVNLANSFPARPVFEEMLRSEIFDPCILVVPFMSVPLKERYISCIENFEQLRSKYKNVVCAWDLEKEQLIDFKNKIDLIFLPSAAIDNQPSGYKIFDFLECDILTAFVSYAYSVQLAGGRENCEFINLVWKNYVPTVFHKKEFVDNQDISGVNAVVSGYPKMDKFSEGKQRKERKQIIIAPHHSIHGIGLRGQFLKYYKLFSELPDIYPDVDFIFRPHPFLNQHLSSRWGEEKVKRYWDNIRRKKNARYDLDDEYHDLFMLSDGIIHDCGSFLPEYLYTDNPPCFLVDEKKDDSEVFNRFGVECLKKYYKAFSEEDVIRYIDDVILQGDDYKRHERVVFAKNNVRVNHPQSSRFIINDLAKEIKSARNN